MATSPPKQIAEVVEPVEQVIEDNPVNEQLAREEREREEQEQQRIIAEQLERKDQEEHEQKRIAEEHDRQIEEAVSQINREHDTIINQVKSAHNRVLISAAGDTSRGYSYRRELREAEHKAEIKYLNAMRNVHVIAVRQGQDTDIVKDKIRELEIRLDMEKLIAQTRYRLQIASLDKLQPSTSDNPMAVIAENNLRIQWSKEINNILARFERSVARIHTDNVTNDQQRLNLIISQVLNELEKL